jgi:ketosteroid isomerase-like protein
MDTRNQIIELEKRLIEAMKTSNVAELDALIADDLIFTGYDGRVYTKEMDLQAHREKGIEIYELETSEQVIHVEDDVAIVSVRKDISGSFFGDVQVGIFRFTRVWKLRDGEWKIIAGHSTQVVH